MEQLITPNKHNVTLENVKKSNYWDLIAILVWNHYSEERYQDESMINIEETWYGKGDGASSSNSNWNNPEYTEEGYTRTLNHICITLTRSDYITYIYINTNGNVDCHGRYVDKTKKKSPYYWGLGRSLDITNWMIYNQFIN